MLLVDRRSSYIRRVRRSRRDHPLSSVAAVSVVAKEVSLAIASIALLAMTALLLNGNLNFQRIGYIQIGRGEAKQQLK
jgi:hypothetical protein